MAEPVLGFGEDRAPFNIPLRRFGRKQEYENEIEAANLVQYETFNAQEQPRTVWPAAFVVARAYLDQVVRVEGTTLERSGPNLPR